jgi:leucyl aminopeptidase
MTISIAFSSAEPASGFLAYVRCENDYKGRFYYLLSDSVKDNINQSIRLINKDKKKTAVSLITVPQWVAILSLEEAIHNLSDEMDNQALLKWDQAIGTLYHSAKKSGLSTLSLDLTGLSANLVARAHYAFSLSSYRFDSYFASSESERAVDLKEIVILCDDTEAAERAYAPLRSVVAGVTLARDLVSEPANILNPETYAERLKNININGLSIEILSVDEMSSLGMNALLGVGQGSVKESKLVIMQYKGAKESVPPIAFVGKGVTFDTGGISIKPAEGMEEMKWDMGGSAAVVGTMIALALREAKVNAVGVVGLVENMPDGNAQRPGDVVKAMSGTTIEVINTDAEGRLVLADALWYTQSRFKPQVMIDLATLTGAMIIALGTDYSGIFSNNDELTQRLLEASKSVGENLWPMPMPNQYEKQIESKIADIRNIGGRAAGSITAALFLQRFVNKTPWAHLDIAPTAWTNEQRIATNPEGGTGFGVRTLNELVSRYYETSQSQ